MVKWPSSDTCFHVYSPRGNTLYFFTVYLAPATVVRTMLSTKVKIAMVLGMKEVAMMMTVCLDTSSAGNG